MRNIIITGGGLVNKGAQAMIYITVSELRRRFPEHKIYLLTSEAITVDDLHINDKNIELLSWHPLKFARAQSNLLLKAICSIKNSKEYKYTRSVYGNCDLMVDISGYSLGSNWPDKICNDFLDNIEYAISFDVPVVLLPQSFGPFDFPNDSLVDKRIRKLLPRVRIICAREKDGYDSLISEYGLKNVVMRPDIVLSSSIDYNSCGLFKYPSVDPVRSNSVALIPNENLLKFTDKDGLMNVYKGVISHLTAAGDNVYLVFHSNNDRVLCEEIKAVCGNNEKLFLADKDLSCVEFNELVKGFKYCVASRFHSIVHSFKNGIPCISLGWAVKYKDLLHEFGQDDYLIDASVGLDLNGIIERIDRMENRCGIESGIILSALENVQKQSVFDILDEVIEIK